MRLGAGQQTSDSSGVLQVVTVAAVGAVAMLAGCVSTSEPMVSPTPVVSAVVTPSPSPALSAEEQMLALIPEEAKGDDLFAAEAMAKFFITLHPGLYQTGDTALWEFLCLPDSVFCSSTVESVNARVARGERQVGGEITIPDQLTDMALDLDAPVEEALIGFSFRQDALEIVDEGGVVLRSQDAFDYRVALALRHVDGLWRVAGVEVSSS